MNSIVIIAVLLVKKNLIGVPIRNYKLHSLIIHLNIEEHVCFIAHGDST